MATAEKAPSAAEAKKEREGDLTDEQVKEQREALAAGKKTPSGTAKLETVAESRSKRPGEKPLFGTVDNMTARDGSDPLEGHFVLIDYSKKATREAVVAQLGDHVEPGIGSADYGVYLEPGEVGKDGYPVTAVVFLRDEHAARIVVPYDCLKRATAGGRR
jgi:hypothetical protein